MMCVLLPQAYSDHDWDPETDQPRQQPVITPLPLPKGGKRQKFGGYAAAAAPQFKKPKLQQPRGEKVASSTSPNWQAN
jgi:hypothetical protein